MLFKGTPTRPPGSIDAELEGLGGNSNAFTSYDFTHYDVVVPLSGLRAAAALLADIAVNAAFVPAELESEKKVVFEEMNLTEDDPERFLTRRLTEAAYVEHPYGRPILGTRELVGGLTRDTRGRVQTIEASYVPRQQSGLVSVTARLDAKHLAAAEAAVREVVRRVRQQGVTPAERERAIITAESTYAFDIETAEGLAKNYGQAETTWSLQDEVEYLKRLRQVTAEQIRNAARTYLADDNYVRVRFLPESAR